MARIPTCEYKDGGCDDGRCKIGACVLYAEEHRQAIAEGEVRRRKVLAKVEWLADQHFHTMLRRKATPAEIAEYAGDPRILRVAEELVDGEERLMRSPLKLSFD